MFGGDRGNGFFGQAQGEPGFGSSYPAGMGMMPPGMPPAGNPYTGIPSAGMPTSGIPPMGGPGMGRPQMGMPSMGNSMVGSPLAGPGGSIRNTLGSELKKRGFFQKDGHINNSRGGFFGPKGQQPVLPQEGGTMGTGPFSFLGSSGGYPGVGNPGGPGGPAGPAGPGGQGPGMPQSRQLILEAAQAGINANGIATISYDNVFSCIANLPLPNSFGQPGSTYAAYLVDSKGQSGFLAGILRPVGNGVYQTQYRSQVPLIHYSRVLVTVENTQYLAHVPRGPVILQVKQPIGPVRFLMPIKNVGGSMWKKVSGIVKKKPKDSSVPDGGIPSEFAPSVGQELLTGNPAMNPLNPMNSPNQLNPVNSVSQVNQGNPMYSSGMANSANHLNPMNPENPINPVNPMSQINPMNPRN